jgi:hypothetical protein
LFQNKGFVTYETAKYEKDERLKMYQASQQDKILGTL